VSKNKYIMRPPYTSVELKQFYITVDNKNHTEMISLTADK